MLNVTSPLFDDGETIPRRFTCEGEDVSPMLRWEDAPDGVVSFAVIVDDPDAPSKTWVHWLVWNIPGDWGALTEEASGSPLVFGRNDFGDVGWGGPCPPAGHGEHNYRFRVYALDTKIVLPEGASREELEDEMAGHVLDEGLLIGTYELNAETA